jgi:hypothetical protein
MRCKGIKSSSATKGIIDRTAAEVSVVSLWVCLLFSRWKDKNTCGLEWSSWLFSRMNSLWCWNRYDMILVWLTHSSLSFDHKPFPLFFGQRSLVFQTRRESIEWNKSEREK